jgi:prevent-host-death family protein
MERVTVTELNQQTARVLELVKSGESLEITEYGRAVARLTPATPTTGVHLATARELREGLTAFVCYDGRLCASAKAAGVPVASPS